MDATSYSSVKTLCKSSTVQSIALKFTMNHAGVFFGICHENFNRGKIGFSNDDSWGWRCDGNEAFHGTEYSSFLRLHTLGDMTNKEVILDYDGRNKRLVISSEGRNWTHTDSTFPTEAFVVFSLNAPSQKVSIIPN